MQVSTIEAEVRGITKLKQKKGEDRQLYLTRTIEALQKLTDDDWEALPQQTQLWANSAADALNAEKGIPDFPDASEADEDGDADEPPKAKTKANGKTKAVKATAKPKEAKPAKAKAKGKDDDAPRKTRGGATGIKVRIKKLIMKQPKITVDDLMAALTKDGGAAPSKFTVSNIRAEFRHSLHTLMELDALKKPLEL